MAIDALFVGFEVDVLDAQGDAARLGYAGSGDHRLACPQARVVALAECGTHAFLAVETGAWLVGEKTLANRLYQRPRRDESLIGDRDFYSFEVGAWPLALVPRWCGGPRQGWACPSCGSCPVGTSLSVLINPVIRGARHRAAILAAADEAAHGAVIDGALIDGAQAGLDPTEAHLVRVVEYDIPDRDGTGTGELIVALTTITDPAAARADELAAASHQRWEEETGNDQLTTHPRGPGKVSRSRSPELVHQEIWAWLPLHHAISALITHAAQAADLDPDRVSFTRVPRITRHTGPPTIHIHTLAPRAA